MHLRHGLAKLSVNGMRYAPVKTWEGKSAPHGPITGRRVERVHGFCRKFSFEAICGMVSPPTHAVKEERDDGDQLQRGLFPTRHYSDGRPLVSRLPFEHA